MQRLGRHQSWRRMGVCLAGFSALALIPFTPLIAQEAEYPANQDAHPGEVVYGRDVPYGSATRRFSQGEARTVVPDQSPLIMNTIDLGLVPMSDADQAAVSAPIMRSVTTGQAALDTGLSTLTHGRAGNGFTRSENGGSTASNAISKGLSVLPGALRILGNKAGGGQ